MPLDCTLKMVKVENSALYIYFTTIKKTII